MPWNNAKPWGQYPFGVVKNAWSDTGSEPWTPEQISTLAWYDASDTSTITESGGSVSQWDDISGNSNHVTQGTAANQPTTDSATINGKNVLAFDGLDFMDVTLGASTTQPLTAFAVYEINRLDVNQYILDGDTSGNRNSILFTASGTKWNAFAGLLLAAGSATDTNIHLLSTTFNSTSSSIYIDAVSSATGSAGTGVLSGIQIGARWDNVQGLSGNLAELVIVEGAITTNARQNFEGYLAHKWGLTANLPSSHPYKYTIPTVGSWTPDQLTMEAWYDSSDTSTITESGGSVSQWDDKSGNGNHVTQGTASNQPTTGTRTLNGINILDFSGDSLELSSFAIPSSGNITFFMVSVVDSVTNAFDGMLSLDATNDAQFMAGNATEFRGQTSVTGIGASTTGGASPNNGPSIYRVNFDFTGSIHNFWVDGTKISNDAAYTTKLDAVQTLKIMTNRGSSLPLDGAFGELCALESPSSETVDRIEGYLAHKWGLTANLPSGHPYKYVAP